MEGVSILIPAYKSGAFIEDCIYSLIHQKHTCDYEILIGVDGCEETLNVVKNIPNVGVYYSKENIGVFPMRNSLVKKAKFDNLLFFDSDDIAQPEILQKTADALEKADAVRWCFYNFSIFGKYDHCKTPAFGAIGIRKSVLLEMNGFATYERFGMDSDFVGRLEQFNKSIAIVEKPMFFRRVHPGSLTRRPDTGMRSPARIALREKIVSEIQGGMLKHPISLLTKRLRTIKKSEVIKPIELSVGIGVTTFNRNEQIMPVLCKIRKYTQKGVRIEVVDDGSPKLVAEATYRMNKNAGTNVAKNKCLELLQDCEHIFLFDDDTYPIKHGWVDAYVSAGVKHLNFTFKYKFEIKDGLKVTQDPNGCMMYVHRDCLSVIGGFDTKFIRYGYWHANYAVRAFNAGLTPYPFCDISESEDYLFCKDKTGGKTSSTNRVYLQRNRRRYLSTLQSREFCEFTEREKPIKVYYSNPYNTQGNIGKGLNEFCELVPDDAWICLQDGDMCYLTPDWGVQIEEVIRRHGHKYALFGCMTNRLARQHQRHTEEIDDNHDMMYHYAIAVDRKERFWAEVQPTTLPLAGLMMVFPKKVWKEIKFKENEIGFDDVFSLALMRRGYKLAIMKGLYVYHLYRAWSNSPKFDRNHLRKSKK